MEAETLNANHPPCFLHRSLPAVVPMLLVLVGYVDPGKWAAMAEGGSRFGYDLLIFVLIFNLAAIFCQYISAKIGVITGKDLAQICSDEYDNWTCMLLGVQTELSVIMLDLNMILGMAYGLSILFGWDLFTCVFLTATGAAFHLLLFVLLDIEKAKVLGLIVSCFVFLSFVLAILNNQPEIPLSISGILTKLSGETAFVLMSLLGATLVPHNFYLHSSLVQWRQESTTTSKDALCHNHFWAIICVFSGLFLVNNVLINVAANEFYSVGFVLTTFQDAMLPMEQVFRSPITMLAFLLILFFSNQTTALTWGFCGEVVVHSFLKLDIPGWLHYATIRVIAVLPALYCVLSSGAEGTYQLLLFTQIVVALQLPSSVIPLFRIASSRSIMGVHKIPQYAECLAWIIFIGMLGLNMFFVIEMLFGSSDWVGNLRWKMASGVSHTYFVLLCTAFASFCLMLWLAATPLKSESAKLDDQAWNWGLQQAVPKPQIDKEEGKRHQRDASVQVKEPSPALARTPDYSDVPVASFHHDLPETIMEPDVPVTTVRETHPFASFPRIPIIKESNSTSEPEDVPAVSNETSDISLGDAKTLKTETSAPAEKTVEVEGDSNAERDEDDGDSWETEEAPKVVPLAPSSASDGPPSFRSLSGKSDDGGNSIGSLSRLAGLGRGARRQLAAILDEFWGQLYDFHGHFTHDAKAKKLDVLLGVDSRLAGSLQKIDACGKDYSEYLISAGSRAPDTPMSSAPYDSPRQPMMQSNLESSYAPQRIYSSLRANPVQSMDEYVQTSSCNLLGAGERRYSSVRNLPSSAALDYQPATIHGYQVASFNQVGKDKNPDNLNGMMELSQLKSTSMVNTINYRNCVAYALGQKLQNGSGLSQPPGFQNVAVSKNNSQLPSERSYYDSRPSGPVDSVGSVNDKKYHSLPDISGYAIPHREVYMSDNGAPWESSVGGYRSSASRTHYEPSLYSNTGSRTGAPLAFDELSPSKVYSDVLSSQLSSGFSSGSLWSRQPFEQFGVDDKIHNAVAGDARNRPSATTQETTSVVGIDGKLIQSFRHCIQKLLKLEGSDWLFKQNDGADEDLIDRVAAREKFVNEVETTEMNRGNHLTSIHSCGEGCVWRADIIISFGVWCIHRLLDLSLMESRPELWGKYTYVLNRLQGIIDPAFSKPRTPLSPCFCLQVPQTFQQKSSSPPSNGMLPPAAKPGRGKCTTAAMVFEMVKDVEIAISSRKGRTGTAAGDVAFPKGKENLASVLKRYKRRLSNKPVNTQEGIRKIPTSAPYNL